MGVNPIEVLIVVGVNPCSFVRIFILFMAITKEKKQDVVKQTKALIQSSSLIVFTDVAGMDVVLLTQLRNDIRSAGGKYRVVKKNLLARALSDEKVEGVDPREMQGEIAVGFGGEDAIALVKAIYSFQKQNEKPVFVGGVMEGEVLSVEQMKHLATLPSREELLARVVGSMNAPVSNFVGVCRASVSSVVYALSAIQKQKS